MTTSKIAMFATRESATEYAKKHGFVITEAPNGDWWAMPQIEADDNALDYYRVGVTDHSQDSDCTIGPDGCCVDCGVARNDGFCPECGGASFHVAGCSLIEPTTKR